MKSTDQILNEHRLRYPEMTAQDEEKLLYQSRFGGGHLISDPSESLCRLRREWEDCLSDGLSHAPFHGLPEEIGGGLCRYPLTAIPDGPHKDAQLAALNRLFVYSASLYEAKNAPEPVGHSSAFREAYHPAYRIVHTELVRFLPLLSAIEEQLSEKALTILAVEGMCGSGKTTLSGLLSVLFGASIIHMDDFFLPPALRTEERLSAPGGNVHYERFLKEVANPLSALREAANRNGKEASGTAVHSEESLLSLRNLPALSHRRFSCEKMAYLPEPVQTVLTPLTIVEGSYCMRPELRFAYDLSIFLSCDPALQKERILKRNGAEAYEIFRTRWIPMELRYFEAFSVKDACTFKESTS